MEGFSSNPEGQRPSALDEASAAPCTPTVKPPAPSTPRLDDSVATGMAAEDFATAMAAAIAAGLRGHMQPSSSSPSLHYSGQDHEDPVNFFVRLDRYLDRSRTDEEDKIYVAVDHLKGDALKWARPVINYQLGYPEFKRRLLNKFNGPQLLAKLRAKLYGERQRDDEPVATFIAKKTSLFARLEPQQSNEDWAAQILELMDPWICSQLRTAFIPDTDELSRMAEQIEGDLQRCRQQNHQNLRFHPASAVQGPRHPTPASRQSTPRQSASRSNPAPPRRPPPGAGPVDAPHVPQRPCRWCGEWHYENTCQQHPYRTQGEGNLSRAATEHTSPRPAPAAQNPPGASRN